MHSNLFNVKMQHSLFLPPIYNIPYTYTHIYIYHLPLCKSKFFCISLYIFLGMICFTVVRFLVKILSVFMVKITKMYVLQSILRTDRLTVPQVIKLDHVSTPYITFPHKVNKMLLKEEIIQ